MQKNDYKSSISAGSFSSEGLTHRAMGHKTGRLHVMFSILEFQYFVLLDFADNVTDIREQLALDLEETQFIAKALGVKHPYDRKNKRDHQMSTDFLVQLEDRTIARTIKPLKKLNKRVIEKFEIERIYWENRDVEWAIVTEKQLSQNLVENLMEFREYHESDEPGKLTLQVMHDFILLWDENITFKELTQEVSTSLEIPYSQCYKIVLHLLSRKKLHFNHTHRFTETLLLKQGNCHVRHHHQ